MACPESLLAAVSVVYFRSPAGFRPAPLRPLASDFKEEWFAIVKAPLRHSPTSRRLFAVVVCLLVVLALPAGCCTLKVKQTSWRQPCVVEPDADGVGNWSLAMAEENYASAVQAEQHCSPRCVDLYYEAAVTTWPALEQELAKQGKAAPRTAELYRSSVAKLLLTAQQYGRWNPCQGLVIATRSGKQIVPATYQGFVWGPEEFHRLAPSGDYSSPRMSRAFRNGGLGVPLVAMRETAEPDPFTQQRRYLSATAVLRPDTNSTGNYQLEFYDPQRESTTIVAGRPVSLASDLTASLVYATQGDDRAWLENFLRPGATETDDGLYMIEPFQPGKIPVVFVHGLLSDPLTWVDLLNELRGRPELNDRFQWWAYRYATGKPFMKSAAGLREQLMQLSATYDPQHCDPGCRKWCSWDTAWGGWSSSCRSPTAAINSGNRLRTNPFPCCRLIPRSAASCRVTFSFGPRRP